LLGTRTREELRGLASLSDAEKLLNFYQTADDTGYGGRTAPARVALLREIIEAWTESH